MRTFLLFIFTITSSVGFANMSPLQKPLLRIQCSDLSQRYGDFDMFYLNPTEGEFRMKGNFGSITNFKHKACWGTFYHHSNALELEIHCDKVVDVIELSTARAQDDATRVEVMTQEGVETCRFVK